MPSKATKPSSIVRTKSVTDSAGTAGVSSVGIFPFITQAPESLTNMIYHDILRNPVNTEIRQERGRSSSTKYKEKKMIIGDIDGVFVGLDGKVDSIAIEHAVAYGRHHGLSFVTGREMAHVQMQRGFLPTLNYALHH